MEKKKEINFVFAIVAVIIDAALWKQFDFDTFKFQIPALAIIYSVVFIASVYLLIKIITNDLKIKTATKWLAVVGNKP